MKKYINTVAAVAAFLSFTVFAFTAEPQTGAASVTPTSFHKVMQKISVKVTDLPGRPILSAEFSAPIDGQSGHYRNGDTRRYFDSCTEKTTSPGLVTTDYEGHDYFFGTDITITIHGTVVEFVYCETIFLRDNTETDGSLVSPEYQTIKYNKVFTGPTARIVCGNREITIAVSDR